MADDDNVEPQPQENPQDSETQPVDRPPADPGLSDYYKREASLENIEKK